MNIFSVHTKICFGSRALEHLSEIKCDRAFIVTDLFIINEGFINKVTQQLEKANIEYEIFSDIIPDSPLEVVAKGIKAMDKADPDVLIAFGEGSVIDAAKAILQFRFMAKEGLPKDDNNRKPKFIAIPITSGTGSEVTCLSVITDKKNNAKYPLVDKNLVADEAILDVSLVKSVPKSITADTGMDVLTHAIEAYVSTNASDCSDALAEKAIKLVFEYLPRAFKNGNDEEAREKMQNAACIAGMAFTNASLGINHSMANILEEKFYIPHGRANALLLPHVIEYNANIQNSFRENYTSAAIKYARIAKLLGLSADNVRVGVRSLIKAIKVLSKNLGLPYKIEDVGILVENYEKEIGNLAAASLKDSCTVTNPITPTLEDLEKLFIKVYYGK